MRLVFARGLGPTLIGRLVETLGSADAAAEADELSLRNIEGFGKVRATEVAKSLRESAADADRELERCHAAGVTPVCPDDPNYPALLVPLVDRPPVLWVRGTLESRDVHAVGVVGSRRCSTYGREQAERLSATLAGNGVTIVSGGARGVDSCAHLGALRATNGRTIAVLGCGVDIAYPPEHEKLFAQIAERGAIVADFPLGTPPVPENFPRRNRIISGLSRGVLVIEADERSGALITARVANEDHHRPVFALPGRVDNQLSAGPHKLIRDGAVLVERATDVLDNLGPLPASLLDHDRTLFDLPPEPDSSEEEPAPPPIALSDRQAKIVKSIDAQALDVDSIVEHTGLSVGEVMQELTMLSIRGVLTRTPDNRYTRKASR